MTKSRWGYKWLSSFGNWSINSKDEIVWHLSNRQTKNGFAFNFYIAQGVINNRDIDKILISTNRNGENEVANIVDGRPVDFWYFISDTPLDGSPDLIGLSADDAVIYNSRE